MAMGMMELGSAISATEFEEAVLKNNKEIRAILDGKAKDSQSSGSRRGAGLPKMLSHMWLAFEIENHVYERAKRDSEIADDKEPFSSSLFMSKYNLFNDLLKNNMQTCDKLGRRLGSKQKSEYMVDQYCKSSIGTKKRPIRPPSSHSHSSSHHKRDHNSAASSSAMDAAAAWDNRFGKGAGGGSQSLPVPAPAASPGLGAAAMGAAATSRPSGLSIQPTIEEEMIDAVEEVELDFGFRLDSPRPTPRPVTTPGASGAASAGAAAGSVRKLSLTLADLGGGGDGGAAGASQPTTPHGGVKATPRPAADASAWGEDEDDEVAAAPDAAHGDAWASAQKDRAAQQQVELERLQRAEAEAAERKAAQEKEAAARQVQAAADAAKRKADEAATAKLEEDRKVRRHCKRALTTDVPRPRAPRPRAPRPRALLATTRRAAFSPPAGPEPLPLQSRRSPSPTHGTVFSASPQERLPGLFTGRELPTRGRLFLPAPQPCC